MRLIKAIALFAALIVVLLAAPMLFMPGDDGGKIANQSAALPWHIERLPSGGSRVFGLVLGESTLEDAFQQLGSDAQVALIVASGETGSVEAYYDNAHAGPITGKMILTLETTRQQREAMLERAVKAEITENAARRVTLAKADLQALRSARLAGITFIPLADLAEDVILQRFGTPAETIRIDERISHWLYPDKGLDVQFDAKGKEVLQYVAPADFYRLRDPLQTDAQ
ncbi:MAG: hypothetical protein ACK4E4_00045 [Rhodocyclaceae bacterium]